MNTERSNGERALRSWFQDGPTAMPDRLIDAVADRIAREPQRSRWRLRGRTFMTTPFKLAAGLAAVLVVAVVAWQLLPGTGGSGGPPTATPSPTPGPTSTPVASGPVPLPDGTLDAGRYRIQPLGDVPSLTITADIPAGWVGHPEVPALTSPDETSNTGVLIGFMVADGLYSDPCHWDLDGTGSIDQPGDVEVGPTVDDLVAALQANASYTSSSPTPVTFGAFTGAQLELQLPGDDVLSTCDEDTGGTFDGPLYFVFPEGFYAQGPDSRWRLSIVDVDGTRLIVMMSALADTPEADVRAGQAVIDSMIFTP